MIRARVLDAPLDVAEHEAAVAAAEAGAVVSFSGVVRNHDHGRGVLRLSYEGHPSAGELLRTVAEEIAARPGVRGVVVSHRVGDLAIGDIAVIVAAGAPHRDAAFNAARAAIDELKTIVPIWKKEHSDDGAVWIEDHA